MPDIISEIQLKVSGTDQAAKKIQDVKKEVDNLNKAQSGGGAGAGSGGGGDPFSRAMGGAGGRGAGQSGDDLRAGMREREAAHRSRTGTEGTGTNKPAGFVGTIRGAMSAVSSAGASGGVEGVAQGLELSKGLMGGGGALATAGGVGLLLAGAAMGINKLSEKDIELRKQLFTGSNIGQKLGVTQFEPLRDAVRGFGNRGYEEKILPLMLAAADSGANNVTTGALSGMLNLNFNTGTDIGAIGKLYGRLQHAGTGGALAYSGTLANAAEAGFGRTRMTEFYSGLTTAIEGAMTRGFQKGDAVFGDAYNKFAQRYADLGRFGNVTLEGANSMMGKIQGTLAASDTGINSPEAALDFMRFRKPGESYTDTLKSMTAPGADKQMYGFMKSSAAGNDETLKLMVMKRFGMGIREAEAYIRTMDTRIAIDNSPVGVGKGGKAIGAGTDYSVVTDFGLLSNLSRFANKNRAGTMFEGLSRFGGSVYDAAIGGIFGEYDPILGDQSGKAYGAAIKNFQNNILTQKPGGKGYDFNALGGENAKFLEQFSKPWRVNRFESPEAGRTAMLSTQLGVQGFSGVMMDYAGYLKYTQMTPAEKAATSQDEQAKYETYGPIFQKLGGKEGYLSQLGKMDMSPEQIERLGTLMQEANALNMDGNTKIMTIVDAIIALQNFIAGAEHIATPDGGAHK